MHCNNYPTCLILLTFNTIRFGSFELFNKLWTNPFINNRYCNFNLLLGIFYSLRSPILIDVDFFFQKSLAFKFFLTNGRFTKYWNLFVIIREDLQTVYDIKKYEQRSNVDEYLIFLLGRVCFFFVFFDSSRSKAYEEVEGLHVKFNVEILILKSKN